MSEVIKNLRSGSTRAAFEAGKLVRLQRVQIERRTREGQRRHALEQLGEAVWRLYADGRIHEPELVGLCHQVQTRTHEIAELDKAAAALRAEQPPAPDQPQPSEALTCPACGRPARAGAAFCGGCGARLPA